MIVSRATILTAPIFLTSLVSAVTLQCDHLRKDGVKFDFSNLSGPHSISVIDKDSPPAVYNTTWTIDICNQLQRDSNIDKANQCPQGTHVCGIRRSYNPITDPKKEHVEVENVIPVAGDYHTTDGKIMEPVLTRLKEQDANTEGLEIELNGGTYNHRSQKAVVRFLCDKTKTGNEGVVNVTSLLLKRDDDSNSNVTNSSLAFASYQVDGDFDILRLNWSTQYACEDALSQDGGSESSGWGFFTWLILILFLGIAAYLIFGSWLNYNRYGARGWDLLPHGDTIRDIPYLFKDFARKVMDTVSGGGRRGGYSAV